MKSKNKKKTFLLCVNLVYRLWLREIEKKNVCGPDKHECETVWRASSLTSKFSRMHRRHYLQEVIIETFGKVFDKKLCMKLKHEQRRCMRRSLHLYLSSFAKHQ